MNRLLSSLSLAALCGAMPLDAQSLPEGYSDTTHALAAGASQELALVGPLHGATAWFDGTDLKIGGTVPTRSLLTFGMPVFGSFLIQIDGTHLLFGESSTGSIWTVDVFSAPPSQPIANLTFNYDAVMLSSHTAIVSARTGGFGAPNNELYALDVFSGTTQHLASLPGASGPVEIHGSLYYATGSNTFPTPPGQTSILRFPMPVVLQALSGNQVLGPAQAHVAFSGLDSASDIVIDQDHDLLFVDWMQNVVGEIDDITGLSPTRKNLIDYGTSPVGAVALQYLPSPSPSAFEPFQPHGGILRVHESDFGATNRVRRIVSHQATLDSSVANPIPAGAFALQVTDGPASGSGLVAIDLAAGPGMHRLHIPGFEQPLLWRMDLLQPLNTHFVTFDAAGSASLPLTNPGFTPPLGVSTQAAFVDAAGTTIGASTPRILHLTQ